MIDLRTINAAWRRSRIAVLPAGAWTTGLILLVTAASYLGVPWLGAHTLGVPIGLWIAAFGGTIAVLATRRERDGAAAGGSLPSWAVDAIRACRAQLEHWQIDPLATASWTGGVILLVSAAAALGAAWPGAGVLGIPGGLWVVTIGAAVAAFMTGRGRSSTAARSGLRSGTSIALQACDEYLRRYRIAILPAAAWTAAVILGVAAWAAPSAVWLGTAFIGVPIGLWLVVFGAGIAAYVTRRAPAIQPAVRSSARAAPSGSQAAPIPARAVPSASQAAPTAARAVPPSVPAPLVQAPAPAPMAPPLAVHPERAILDFNPPGPAPRESVPRPRPKRAKARAAAVPAAADSPGAPRAARSDAAPPARRTRRREAGTGSSPKVLPGSGESARPRRAGRT